MLRASLGRKQKEKTTENKPKAIKRMVIEPYISIITLNTNGLNAPDIDWLGRWRHVHVCTSTYQITLLDLPIIYLYYLCNYLYSYYVSMYIIYILRLIMSPLWRAIVIIFYFLSSHWLWKLINIYYYCDYVTAAVK